MIDTLDGLTIHLLGAPEAQIAGIPLALHHQKAQALLYYLAATGRSHRRDYLATLLWSEAPESNARHSLRSSLYHIRQAFRPLAPHAQNAGEALTGDSDLVYLHLNDKACDITHFRRLLVEGNEQALTRAVTLYRGPFLQGFSLIDAPLYEEWLRFERNELAQAYLTVLQRLASWAEERQDWNQAILYTQRIIQLDPLAEVMQQRLIKLYLRTGAIGQALRHYHQFEQELQQEFGLTPSPETLALLSESLTTRHGTTIQLQTYSSRQGTHASQVLPFIGRDNVLEQLLTMSQEARNGQGSTVLIQGEDGSGRSYLLDELAARLPASQQPWMILQGSCSPFDDLLSYGPFLEALGDITPGDLSGLLSQVWETDTSEQRQFLKALQLLTHAAPVLLTIDDLQWANSPTLHLFGFLATRLRNLPVLLVGTVHRVEAIPALQRLVTLGRRHGDVHLLSLSPLTVEDVRTLISRLEIGPLADTWPITAFSEWLYEKSSGNPFIIAAIIAQLQAERMLIPHEKGLRLDVGRWRRWRATFVLPETTHDLVAWRLTTISPHARTLLDALAVANLPLPYKLLREFPGIQGEQLLATIEDLEARGLVMETGNEQVAIAHNLLRENLLHQLSNLRRQHIHGQLASIIEQCPALQDQFPLRQIALHAVAGEDSERARRYGLRIVEELVQDNANTQTAAFLRHLHDLLAPTAAPDEMLRLTSALGQVYRSLGQLEEAASWHHRHLELARKIANLPAQAAAQFELGELALVANDYQKAASAAESGLAIELLTEQAQHLVLHARGHRLLGAALAMEGSDLPSAEHHLQEAVAAHRHADNMGDLCATLFELGNVAAQRGELRHALAQYEEAASAAEIAHMHYFLALAKNNFAYHSLLLGDVANARQALGMGKKLAERYELFGALMHLSSTQGEIHLYLGEWQAAIEAFQYGLAQAEELCNIERQAGNRAGLALAEREQGNPEVALTLLTEALTLITEQGYWHLRVRIQLWLAETLVLSGNFSQAELHLKTALATAQTHDRRLLLLQAKRLHAYLLAARGNWSAAHDLFFQALEHAFRLDLSLEAARTKATWGQALIRYALHAPYASDGYTLLSEALQVFASYNAIAELHTHTGVVPM